MMLLYGALVEIQHPLIILRSRRIKNLVVVMVRQHRGGSPHPVRHPFLPLISRIVSVVRWRSAVSGKKNGGG